MNQLGTAVSLRDLQNYVEELEADRGFSRDSVSQKCILLGEEIGELFRAIRRSEGMGIDVRDNRDVDPAHELADIFIILATIANRLSIDLEDAIRVKEEINRHRAWA
jgi:NTP pyrophosphatase (non-canonical NTP hydrolase)